MRVGIASGEIKNLPGTFLSLKHSSNGQQQVRVGKKSLNGVDGQGEDGVVSEKSQGVCDCFYEKYQGNSIVSPK